MDIIIALGTAKEGFDWQWCEMCLTVGVRGSLTEVKVAVNDFLKAITASLLMDGASIAHACSISSGCL